MTAIAAPALPLATVTAMDLAPGDLIGGTCGQWLTVASVYIDPNARHLVAEIDVHPVGEPDRTRPWQIDAFAKIAIVRPDGSSQR